MQEKIFVAVTVFVVLLAMILGIAAYITGKESIIKNEQQTEQEENHPEYVDKFRIELLDDDEKTQHMDDETEMEYYYDETEIHYSDDEARYGSVIDVEMLELMSNAIETGQWEEVYHLLTVMTFGELLSGRTTARGQWDKVVYISRNLFFKLYEDAITNHKKEFVDYDVYHFDYSLNFHESIWILHIWGPNVTEAWFGMLDEYCRLNNLVTTEFWIGSWDTFEYKGVFVNEITNGEIILYVATYYDDTHMYGLLVEP